MKLRVINTGSIGNCYLFEANDTTLIVECGVRFEDVKKTLNHNFDKVIGAILTHEHGDHSKAVKDFVKRGIDVYCSPGTIDAINIQHHRLKPLQKKSIQNIGSFQVIGFDVKHDCKEPLGFLIRHKEMGTTLFLTDTYYVENTFKGLNHVIIEANYSDEIIEQKSFNGTINPFVRDRVYKSHMSLETCIKTLKANDLSSVKTITLIHLSDSNSDARLFKKRVEQETGIPTYVAEKGMEIILDIF